MARLCITTANGRTQVACSGCGGKDMFQHNLRLLTCNKCGHTFGTEHDTSLMVEAVVTSYNGGN